MRKRDILVPTGEVFGGLDDGSVKALRREPPARQIMCIYDSPQGHREQR